MDWQKAIEQLNKIQIKHVDLLIYSLSLNQYLKKENWKLKIKNKKKRN